MTDRWPRTIDECEAEPIRTPGLVQRHGGLVVFDGGGVVTHASESVGALLARPAERLLGRPLHEAIGADAAGALRGGARARTDEIVPWLEIAGPGGVRLAARVAATASGLATVDLEPLEPDEAASSDTVLLDPIRRVLAAEDGPALVQTLVRETSALLGYDRVQFLALEDQGDGDGVVVAELARPGVATFAGLRFPATDVPRIARALYRTTWSRGDPDVLAPGSPILAAPGRPAPPDLSRAALRSLSPAHRAYVVGMGARATFSLSIRVGETLFGLVVAQNLTPRCVPPRIRTPLETLADVASRHLDRIEHERVREAAFELKQACLPFLGAVAEGEPLADALQGAGRALASLARADGFAIALRDQVGALGLAPTRAELAPTLERLAALPDGYTTTELARDLPEVARAVPGACGALVRRTAPGATLVWFRRERVATIDWAGRPPRAAGEGVAPLRSFERWKETVRGTAETWEPEVREATGSFERRLAPIVTAEQTGARRFRPYAALLERVQASLVVTDRDGRIEWVNPGFTRLSGFSLDEVRGRTPGEALQGPGTDPAQVALIRESIRAGRSFRGEVLNYSKTRVPYWVDLDIAPVTDEEGAISGFVGIQIDVTRAHEALAESETRTVETAERLRGDRLASLGRLAGGIAHDFNNLLQAIGGFADLLETRSRLRADPTDVLRGLRSSVARARELTGRLLTFGRPTGPATLVDVADLLEETVVFLERLLPPTVSLDVRTGGSIWNLACDRGALQQALVNLVLNARDALPDGGRVTLDAANEDPPARDPDRRLVRVEVRDDGAGMDAATQARLFEPFFTTKGPGKGTGLGLASVHAAITEAGGRLEVASQLGRGTTVRLWLPAAPVVVLPPTPLGRVLLVEDDPASLAVAAGHLRAVGHTVLEARSGTEALELASRETEPVDLVVAELAPGGLSGLALAQRLSRRWPEVGALYLSGTIPPGGAMQDLDVLPRPFSGPALVERVRSALEARWDRRAAPKAP